MAVAFSTDLSTFVPERPIYAVGENSDGSLAWMTNQLMDFQISVDAEEDTKTDANGNTIFSISRAKSCDVSFTTPLLTLELVASMNGSEVERGTNDDKIAVPKFETVKLVATAGKVTIDTTTTTISLAQIVRNSGTVGTPVYKVSAAFLTKDGSTRKKLEKEQQLLLLVNSYSLRAVAQQTPLQFSMLIMMKVLLSLLLMSMIQQMLFRL